jgi:hypothetical protein
LFVAGSRETCFSYYDRQAKLCTWIVKEFYLFCIDLKGFRERMK